MIISGSTVKIKTNRLNAQRSTGPRTPTGRHNSSLNARKHGLSATPPAEDTMHHLRLILENPTMTPQDAAKTPRGATALALATAEARLTLAQRHAAAVAIRDSLHALRHEIEMVLSILEDPERLLDIETQESGRERLRALTAAAQKADESARRAARRHLQEAHARRRKALLKFLELD